MVEAVLIFSGEHTIKFKSWLFKYKNKNNHHYIFEFVLLIKGKVHEVIKYNQCIDAGYYYFSQLYCTIYHYQL